MSKLPVVGPAEAKTSPPELAASAARSAREEEESKRVADGKDITSLNRLLQWGAANSEPKPHEQSAAGRPSEALQTRGIDELKKDREWLDAAFPDMFAEIKRLSAILAGKHPPDANEEERQKPPLELDDDMRVEILGEIEECMADLNFATNITKLGTLAPVLKHATHPTPKVRAAALWVLGTSMQDVDDVKMQVLDAGGVDILVTGLADKSPAPRSKACMAVTSLLRHAKPVVLDSFRASGGGPLLQGALIDEDVTVRRRAMFFLQHSHTSGNAWFPDAVLRSEVLTGRIAELLARAPVDDCALIESSAGALQALAQEDHMRVLELVPSLLGVVERLNSIVDVETRTCLDDLSAALSPSVA
jgi:hypothetical protein